VIVRQLAHQVQHAEQKSVGFDSTQATLDAIQFGKVFYAVYPAAWRIQQAGNWITTVIAGIGIGAVIPGYAYDQVFSEVGRSHSAVNRFQECLLANRIPAV